MDWTLTVLGLAIVGITIVDALRTTMQLGRGGTLSSITSRVVWRIVISLPRWPGKFFQTLAGRREAVQQQNSRE